jgi:MFS family permease
MSSRERQRWLMAVCLFVALFLLWGSAFNTAGLFIPPLVKQFGWNRTRVSLLFAVLALASGLSSPAAGRLLEWTEARLVIAAGAILSGLGLIAASRASSFTPMLLAYVTVGLGLGFSTFVPAALVVSNWFGERRGMALGIVMGGQSLGGMVMAPLVSYAIASSGWRAGEVLLAAPMFLIVTPLVLGFVLTRPPDSASVAAEVTHANARDLMDAVPGLEIAQALRTRSFWMIILAQLFFPLAAAGAFVHMVAYLIGIGYGEAVAALSLSLVLLFATIGQPLMGVVADRIGGRAALALAFALLAISLLMLLAANKAVALGLFVFVFGLIVAGPIVLVPVVVAESLGVKRYGSLMGLVGLPFTLGLGLGPLAAGGIYDLTASYAIAFQSCVVISLMGVAASLICVPLEWEKGTAAVKDAS